MLPESVLSHSILMKVPVKLCGFFFDNIETDSDDNLLSKRMERSSLYLSWNSFYLSHENEENHKLSAVFRIKKEDLRLSITLKKIN